MARSTSTDKKAAEVVKQRSEGRELPSTASAEELARMLSEVQNRLADCLLYVTAVKTLVDKNQPERPAKGEVPDELPAAPNPQEEARAVWGN